MSTTAPAAIIAITKYKKTPHSFKYNFQLNGYSFLSFLFWFSEMPITIAIITPIESAIHPPKTIIIFPFVYFS